jgi:hypothetical protein
VDATRAPAIQAGGIAVHEEAVAELLLDDLWRG